MPLHAEFLRRYLAESLGRPVILRLNRNTHTYISVRPDRPGPGLRVSLHEAFLAGNDAIAAAILGFLAGREDGSRAIIREFIARHGNEGPSSGSLLRRKKPPAGSSIGRVYSLSERAARLNELYFENALDFRIIWGKRQLTKRQRHITLGTWNPRLRLIRIHPILDQNSVPDYFVDFVIFHEMTHIAVPSVIVDGRVLSHTPAFRQAERRYPAYAAAMRWERRFLPNLLRLWNKGRVETIEIEPEKGQENTDNQLEFLP